MQGGPSRIRESSLPLTPPVFGTLVDQKRRSPQTRAHDTQRISSLQYFARRAEELASGAFETFTEVHTVSFPVGMFVQFSSMIYQGVAARFPKLRLAFLEVGCTWLLYWLDRMDEHWEKRGKIETPSLKQRPSDCVRQQPIFFSFEAEEKLLAETLRYVGDDHFVYATDIPHWDCEFPENLRHTQARNDLSDETKNKVLYDNVKALYGI